MRLLPRCLLCVAVVLFGATVGLTEEAAKSRVGKSEIAFRMVKERRGFQIPHLTKYHDRQIVAFVNRQIDNQLAEVGCSDEPWGEDKTLEVRSAVKLAAHDIFSVYMSASYFCGAYPENNDDRSLTFDLRTGKAVSFEELFRDYVKERRTILATIFRRQVEAAASRKEGTETDSGSCEDYSSELYSLDHLAGDESSRSNFFFNFTAGGLEVEPDWPHVVEACAERVTVPYAQLRAFAAPGGLLERMQD